MYDVAIIGAGVVGAAIGRELTKYNLKIVILEKENDIAMGTTKANSAIVHGGYDPEPETLMAKLNVEGSKMFPSLCKELDVPYQNNQALVLAFSDEDLEKLNLLLENGVKNSVKGLQILDKHEVYQLEPNIQEEVTGALLVPSSGIVGPFELCIALVENAVQNGADIKLNFQVDFIQKKADHFVISSKESNLSAKYVINAAGLNGDEIHNMVSKNKLKTLPNKGSYFVLDKSQAKGFKRTLFQCPTNEGKGVLVTPTVHGNMLVGPTSKSTKSRNILSVEKDELDKIKLVSKKTTNKIDFTKSIREFSGSRAYLEGFDDFYIKENEESKGFIDVIGIKSPGLSAAPAIAVFVAKLLKESGLLLEEKNNYVKQREQLRFSELDNEEKMDVINENKTFGNVICRCELITEGEIIDAIRRPVGATTVDGIKRRCRPGMGRCQGGFCGPKVLEILSKELNVDPKEITMENKGSYLIYGNTKEN